MNNYPDTEQEEIPLSRTKRKEHVEELQELGIELIKYSKDKLAKLDLPPIYLKQLSKPKNSPQMEQFVVNVNTLAN